MNFVFSKKTTLGLVDQVFTDHDAEVIEMKGKAEGMWKDCSSQRERRTLASQEVPGFSFFGDNIGITFRVLVFFLVFKLF